MTDVPTIIGKLSGKEITLPNVNAPPMPALAPWCCARRKEGPKLRRDRFSPRLSGCQELQENVWVNHSRDEYEYGI